MKNRHPDSLTQEPYRMLSRIPEEPSSDFTDRVMSRLPSAIPVPEERKQPAGRNSWKLRPELANAMVATAATYVLLSTGLIKLVFSLDTGAVETGLYLKMTAVMDWVGRIANSIPS